MIFQKMSVRWTLVLITGVSESKGPQEDLDSFHASDKPSLSLDTLEKWFGLGLLVCSKSAPLD